MKYIGINTKYPEIALDNRISGTIFVEFIISENGRIRNPIVKKTMTKSSLESEGVKALEKEAKRVVLSMPNWIPGEINNNKVESYFIIPVNFKVFKN